MTKLKYNFFIDRHATLIRSDFNEIFEPNIRNKLKLQLQNQNLVVQTEDSTATSDLVFLEKFVTQIGVLIPSVGTSLDNLRMLLSTISSSNINVRFLIFVFNNCFGYEK